VKRRVPAVTMRKHAERKILRRIYVLRISSASARFSDKPIQTLGSEVIDVPVAGRSIAPAQHWDAAKFGWNRVGGIFGLAPHAAHQLSLKDSDDTRGRRPKAVWNPIMLELRFKRCTHSIGHVALVADEIQQALV